MADPSVAEPSRGLSAEASALAIKRFSALSREVRGSAILGLDGVVAASGSENGWAEAGSSLLGAADRAAGKPASHAHVATEEGEVFAVRAGDLAMVAVTSRFTLASLVFADMRSALKQVREDAAAPPAKAA